MATNVHIGVRSLLRQSNRVHHYSRSCAVFPNRTSAHLVLHATRRHFSINDKGAKEIPSIAELGLMNSTFRSIKEFDNDVPIAAKRLTIWWRCSMLIHKIESSMQLDDDVDDALNQNRYTRHIQHWQLSEEVYELREHVLLESSKDEFDAILARVEELDGVFETRVLVTEATKASKHEVCDQNLWFKLGYVGDDHGEEAQRGGLKHDTREVIFSDNLVFRCLGAAGWIAIGGPWMIPFAAILFISGTLCRDTR